MIPHYVHILAVVCVGAVSSALAQLPQIDRIDQSSGGQRGTEFELTIEGQFLSGVQDVLLFRRGVRFTGLHFVDDATLRIKLNAEPLCELGEYPFVLVSKSGLSELRSLQIGPFLVREEAEPNSTLARAQPIQTPVTITGLIDEADEDWFRVTLSEGERLSAEVVALPLGHYLFDALLQVYNGRGELLAQSDDTALLRQDPFASIRVPETGDYFVKVREAAFGGDLDSRYRIHIGSFARPTILYPAGGLVGTTQVSLLGDPLGPIRREIKSTAMAGLTEPIFITEGDEATPSPLWFRTSDVPNILESEPNNDFESANRSPLGWRCALNGILSQPEDEDYFRFDLEAGKKVDVSLYAARIGSPIDSVLTVFSPDGRELSSNDDGFVHDSRLRIVAPIAGAYTLRVHDHLRRGSETGVYRIEFELPQPQLELRVPTVSGSMSQTLQSVVVPRGSRVPMLVACRRQNSTATIQLSATGLPAGLAFASDPIDSTTHLTLTSFSAEPTTPIGAHLVSLSGSFRDAKQFPFRQHIGLVHGQPLQTIYHAVQVDKLPIMVTESAPFSIEVTPPTSPLVQSGRLDLQVIIRRHGGFDDDIELTIPQTPPWIRGPEEPLKVPAGQNSAHLSLFAEREAAEQSWTLLVAAKADTSLGPLTIASELFRVDVAAPYVAINIDRTVTEQASRATVPCQLDWKRKGTSAAIAALLGLPKGAGTPTVTIQPGQTSFEFPVSVSSETPAAIHNTLYVELTVPETNESVVHYLGHGATLEVTEGRVRECLRHGVGSRSQ